MHLVSLILVLSSVQPGLDIIRTAIYLTYKEDNMAKQKTTKEKHPLYGSWSWIRRMRTKSSISDEWLNFDNFVKDMGSRPTPQHRLDRKDKAQGYSKSNCYWKETISNKDAAANQRAHRKRDPDRFKGYDLKRSYGITLEEFKSMKESQGNVCKVCKLPEPHNRELAVDHCHITGKVRGLLCTNCNQGLGLFKDNRDLLLSAIKYLGA